MNREQFLTFLFGLPFGSFLAKRVKRGEQKYLLNKFYVAGFQYYSGPSFVSKIETGEVLDLVTEPENHYDPFAVKIYRKGTMLGHVPRSDNKHISRLLQQNVELSCVVTEVDPERETWRMLKVEIYL